MKAFIRKLFARPTPTISTRRVGRTRLGMEALDNRELPSVTSVLGADGVLNITGDSLNCGGVGRVCAPAEVCSLGRCSPVCAAGFTQCGRDCVNPLVNPRHCGTCGTGCGPGQACISGRCRP